MRWLALFLVVGCAGKPWQRALPASFIPALELRALYRVRRPEYTDLGFGAWLRWTPMTATPTIGSQLDEQPATWLAPCELDDLICLSEVAEAEPEIAAALREQP